MDKHASLVVGVSLKPRSHHARRRIVCDLDLDWRLHSVPIYTGRHASNLRHLLFI